MQHIFKKILAAILGEYCVFRIYRCDLAELRNDNLFSFFEQGYEFREVSEEEVVSAAAEEIRARAHYCGNEAISYGVLFEGDIICLQWFWFGERYRQRNFWPLDEGQAKSVELFTLPAYRGKGLASALKRYSAERMRGKGFRQLFSRIWYNHYASITVSERCGWKYIALVGEFHPSLLKRKLRLVIRFSESSTDIASLKNRRFSETRAIFRRLASAHGIKMSVARF